MAALIPPPRFLVAERASLKSAGVTEETAKVATLAQIFKGSFMKKVLILTAWFAAVISPLVSA